MSEPLELLAFSPHPDDAELFAGGLIAKMAAAGYQVGIVDLTRGELGTHGDVATRAAEAHAAGQLLGLTHRENLGLPDGALAPWDHDDLGPTFATSPTGRLVEALRRLRPALVLAPPLVDRHPDHAVAGSLVRRAVFLSGLEKLDVLGLPPHRPRQTLHYSMRHALTPSFIVDVSAVASVKRAAILAHRSQVGGAGTDRGTLIGSSLALDAIEARDRYFGSMIGVAHGEPFITENAIAIDDPVAHFRQSGAAHFFPTHSG